MCFRIWTKVSYDTGGQDSEVNIVNCYELDGPGIETWWGQDFSEPSRPALEAIQPPL